MSLTRKNIERLIYVSNPISIKLLLTKEYNSFLLKDLTEVPNQYKETST